MSRWIAVALSLTIASAALATPRLPQTAGPTSTTQWRLERGSEEGVEYVAVTATNTGTDIALHLVCAADGGVAMTLFGEGEAPPEPDETVMITTRVTGQPLRRNNWVQGFGEGDARTFELDGKDAYDLIAALTRAATGDVVFEVTADRLVTRYTFDLGNGGEERSLLAATCASWQAGSNL